ncbi:MAG: DUF3846 domain-containing protein [Dermatophilaceae bacterium]
MRALIVPTFGDARVVQLPNRPELEHRTIQELIGCGTVEVRQLATDLTMWLDEEAALRPVPPELNRAAMRIGAAFGDPRRFVGTVIYGGGPGRRGDTTSLADTRLSELAEHLDHVGVNVAVEVPAARNGSPQR